MVTQTLTFKTVKEAFQQNALKLIEDAQYLFVTDTNKDELWDTYLSSFPEADRQEFNCNACRQFIKQWGNIVTITQYYEVRSLWGFTIPDRLYQRVFNRLDALISMSPICDILVTDTAKLGTDSNLELLENGETHRWHHLSLHLPRKFVTRTNGQTLDTIRSEKRAAKEVFKSSLEQLTIDATQTVLELISSNTLYRGAEFKGLLESFLKHQLHYAQLAQDVKDNYCWLISATAGASLSRMKNLAIGTLLSDLSDDMDINEAVTRFERQVMAPANYKRPTALFTKSMVEDAERKLTELGLAASLNRRHATLHDLTVNNLLFVDRSARPQIASIFEILKQDALVNPRKFDKVQSVSLDTFVKDVLPTVQSVELLLENKHQKNLVSIIAPGNPDAPSLFKWDNGFSWSYTGAYADSVKERVKQAGGEVDGKLRISLAWSNYDDLDLHLVEPNGREIFFRDKYSPTGGQLDVDMNAGGGETRKPVENIFYPHNRKLPEGEYTVFVHQYCHRESCDVGFTLEVEYEGNTLTFEHPQEVRSDEKITVLTFSYSKYNGFEVLTSINESAAVHSKELWGLRSNQFHRVNALMFSPNHWDNENATGNKHLFAILDGCKNDEPKVRGFFNEFLKESLTPHRKVFEALANRLEVSNNVGDSQLSGVGFSLTQPTEFIVKVKGATERILKVTI